MTNSTLVCPVKIEYVTNNNIFFLPKKDGEKGYRKNISEIPPCTGTHNVIFITEFVLLIKTRTKVEFVICILGVKDIFKVYTSGTFRPKTTQPFTYPTTIMARILINIQLKVLIPIQETTAGLVNQKVIGIFLGN